MVERAIARGPVVHVVAALHAERDRIAERPENVVRPGPERHDGFARLDEAGFGRHAPAVRRLLQAARIAGEKPAAVAGEQSRIGRRQPARIDAGGGIAQHDRAGETFEARLDFGERRRVQRVEGQAVVADAPRLDRPLGQRPLGPKSLDPAGRADQPGRAGGLGQLHVFVEAAFDQRQGGAGVGGGFRRRAFEKIARDPRQGLRQRGPVDSRRRIGPEDRAQDRGEVARKRVELDGGALDQPRIAIARLAPGRAAAIDQRDVAPARLQRQRRADADHARAQYDHIRPYRHAALLVPGNIGAQLAPMRISGRGCRARARRPYLSHRKRGSGQP